jgi:predicted RecA/RadA family phage recombinase
MAKNFKAVGDVFDHTLTAAVIAGAVVVMADTVGVALSDGAIGDEVAVRVGGVFELPKASADDIAQGAKVYWDATPGNITTDATAPNVYAGHAFAAAGASTTTVLVRLNA